MPSRHLRLSIALLGPWDVRIDGAPVTTFEYAKVRALLAYLVIQAGRPASRDQICALLWPNAPERAARRNLSQALAQLRRALHDSPAAHPLISATTEVIYLAPEVVSAEPALNVDVWRFKRLLADCERHRHRGWHLCTSCGTRLREAVALYRGDFLSHLSLPDSAPFEEWSQDQRGPLRQAMLGALERLALYAEWRGDDAQAVAGTRRQIELDPWNEPHHRELLRLLALSGQRAAALEHATELVRTLRSELQMEPEAATLTLVRAIRDGALTTFDSRRQSAPIRLPVPPTTLIGRSADVDAVQRRLNADGARLITLCGPAGVGKTRLAVEVAGTLRHDFEDGVTFVDLTSIADPNELPGAIARTLAIPEAARRSPLDTVRAHLRERHLLLLLDNFEHVFDAAPQVADLLGACPHLIVLATSRTPLRLRAEQVIELRPLEVPDPAADLVAIGAAPAVKLLVDRLAAARPTFALDAASAPSAAEICRRLDGLPLAIELIAGHARSADTVELLRQAERDGLQALETGPRDLPDRQRTLRHALNWSHNRLTPEHQRVFAWLGVFAGGFTPESAVAVLADQPEVGLALTQLRAINLITVDPAPDGVRYRLLETVREFARERLLDRSEFACALSRHAEHFLTVAQAAQAHLEGPDQGAWFDRLSCEQANFQAALHWCQDHDRALGVRLCVALTLFWRSRGHIGIGRGWLHALTAGDPLPALLLGPALVAACRLAWAQGDVEPARRLADEARAVCARAEEGDAYAEALNLLGDLEAHAGEIQAARTHLDQALVLYRDLGRPAGEAETLHFLSRMATTQGDYARGIELGLQSLAIYRELGNPRKAAGQELNLGVYAFEQGDFATARQLTTDSLGIFRGLGDVTGVSIALLNLGNTLRETGDPEGARQALEEAVVIERQRHGRALAAVLGALGEVLLKIGDPSARNQLAESLQLRLRSGEANGLAITLELLARVHFETGRAGSAARLLGAADAVRTAGQAALHPNRRVEHERFVSRVKLDLGEMRYEGERAAGRALSKEQAATLALEV
ncbi:MAG: tetratricopeptide repeat protein [Anaerolineales bacterium]|nr:tetratricopeptide repeat protein [Anaerolineales bacterium]